MGSEEIIPLLIIVLVPVWLFVFLPISARNKVRADEEAFAVFSERYAKVRGKRNRIKKLTKQHWPIWPRPVLFEEIDQSTQLTLGRAEYALEEIEEIKRSIESVDSSNSQKDNVFNVLRHIRVIQICSRNKKRFIESVAMEQTITAALQILDENRKRVSELQNEVKRRTVKLKGDYSNAESNISFYKELGTVHYTDICRNLKMARNCSQKAEAEIKGAAADDLIEWPAADLLCRASQASLAIYYFKGQALSYSENYEADETLAKLYSLTSDLETALIAIDFHNWKRLVELRDYLVYLETELQTVEILLKDFEEKAQELQSRIYELMAIDLSSLYSKAIDTEKALSEFVGTPLEAPEVWANYLHRQDLPSSVLIKRNYQLENEMYPLFQGTVIQESRITSTLSAIDVFIGEIKKIQTRINRLENITRWFMRCETEVKRCVSENGEMFIVITNIDKIINNSTKEIVKGCKLAKEKFLKYKVKAFGARKQANFPYLMQGLAQLQTECQGWLEKHQYEIDRLRAEAHEQHREINGLQTELNDLKSKSPIVTSINWIGLFLEFNELEQEFTELGQDYQLLCDFISHAEAFYNEKMKFRRKIEQQHISYQNLYDESVKRLDSTFNEISRQLEKFRGPWAYPLSGHIANLMACQEAHKKVEIQLQSLRTDVGLSMSEANLILENLRRQLDDLDTFKKGEIDAAKYTMRELDALKKYVDSLLKNQKAEEINPEAVKEARIRINNALQADDPNRAKRLLAEAKTILENITLYAPINLQVTNSNTANTLFGDAVSGNKTDVKNVRGRSRVQIAGRDMIVKTPSTRQRKRR